MFVRTLAQHQPDPRDDLRQPQPVGAAEGGGRSDLRAIAPVGDELAIHVRGPFDMAKREQIAGDPVAPFGSDAGNEVAFLDEIDGLVERLLHSGAADIDYCVKDLTWNGKHKPNSNTDPLTH